MPYQASPYKREPAPVTPPAATAPPAASSHNQRTGTGESDCAGKPVRKRCLNEGAHKLSY